MHSTGSPPASQVTSQALVASQVTLQSPRQMTSHLLVLEQLTSLPSPTSNEQLPALEHEALEAAPVTNVHADTLEQDVWQRSPQDWSQASPLEQLDVQSSPQPRSHVAAAEQLLTHPSTGQSMSHASPPLHAQVAPAQVHVLPPWHQSGAHAGTARQGTAASARSHRNRIRGWISAFPDREKVHLGARRRPGPEQARTAPDRRQRPRWGGEAVRGSSGQAWRGYLRRSSRAIAG